MKILAPAGNFESLKMAVINGADEVYLGINSFNARNNIDGFTLENLKSAVDYAHVYGVKVHLAINILFSDSELKSALDTVVDAFNMGVDAFIIQDLGLIYLIKEHCPEIEIHASTQMGLHNFEGVNYIDKYGVKRVVLARETPLKEIARINEKTDTELEYFAQGALCVSFSGNCYLSSYLFDDSGNRGRCKQLCRLPYTLTRGGKKIKKGYLLSAKDFNMADRLGELKDAGIDAIKIEGRARRAFYVATATREYRKALDGKNVDENALKLAFNRTFTPGYFDGNGNIISQIQNHIGLNVGKVERVEQGKKFNRIFFSSNTKISPKSTLKFFARDTLRTTLSAYDLKEIEGLYVLTTTHSVQVGDKVNLIMDAALEQEVLALNLKRKISVKINAVIGLPITALVNIGGKDYTFTGEVLESSKSQPLTHKDLVDCFEKSEYFTADLHIENLDNVFLPKAKLNQFRRDVFDGVYKILTEIKRDKISYINLNSAPDFKRFSDFKIIDNYSDLPSEKNVIYSPETYNEKDVEKFKNACEKSGKNAYLDTPNFALSKDVELLKSIIKNTGVGVVANNYYALEFSENTVVGAGLNVYNSYTANALGFPVITAESDIAKRVNFPYMTLRHCPMKEHLKCTCNSCVFSNDFEYVTDGGKRLKLKRKRLSDCTFYLTD